MFVNAWETGRLNYIYVRTGRGSLVIANDFRYFLAPPQIVLHTSMLEPSGDLCSRTRANPAPCSSLLERARAALACSSGLGILEYARVCSSIIERHITFAPIHY